MDRRLFLQLSAAALAAGCARGEPPMPGGRMLATRHDIGHRLRSGTLPAPGESIRRAVVIVGGGIGGLSAAWRLRRAGIDDFEILELESRAGGNSGWGENDASAYPWGAHYLPLQTRESRSVRTLLGELGVIIGDPHAASPRYEERYLCFTPQERHYRNGVWREGLAPIEGAGAAELAQWNRFHEAMARYKVLRGSDGRKAFAIPIDLSSRDPALVALDRLTMHDWLHEQGFTAKPVHWLADYACRDDYGTSYRLASAWAGIHYFASRDATATNADSDTVLTWPEGNGWLVRRMMERVQPATRTGALAYRIEPDEREIRLSVFVASENRSITIRAEQVIWAAPLRFAARALGGAEAGLTRSLQQFDHAPWIVVNLTLSELPRQGYGAPLAWDNVLYDSTSLGYVVATHQSISLERAATVLTYYLPFPTQAPKHTREMLLQTTRERWAKIALDDLARPHPEIRELTINADVMANGHAMVRPLPGAIWGAARAHVLERHGRLTFAHSDASGISIFEEAHYRGVVAAERVLHALGDRSASVL